MKQSYTKKLHKNMLKLKEPNTQYGIVQDLSIVPEEITYKNLHTNNKRNTISYKSIKISAHAKQMASIRLGINSERELQKLCASAKRNGLNMNIVTMLNYDKYGLSFKHYKWLKDKCKCPANEPVYFYKGYFFVFTGKSNHTLKTIIYPGLPIESEKSIENDIVDSFFSSIHETQFHNINHTNLGKKNIRAIRNKI